VLFQHILVVAVVVRMEQGQMLAAQAAQALSSFPTLAHKEVQAAP
jgi:hypothetical protein